MPLTPEGLAVTAGYRRRLLQIRDQVTRQVIEAWALVDATDLRGTFPRWQRLADSLLTAGQLTAVDLASAYTDRFARVEVDDPPPSVDTRDIAGRTRDGRPVADVLRTSLAASLVAAGQGRDPLRSGVARAVRTSRTEVFEAARTVEQRVYTADERVSAYRRVTSSTPCGACLAMSGGVSDTRRRIEVHGHCRCTAEPVYRDREEQAPRPSGRELFEQMSASQQERLYGAEVAAAIRRGMPLEELVARNTGPEWGTSIHQASKSQLAGAMPDGN